MRLPKWLRGPKRATIRQRRRAARSAYIGGILLIISGGAGALALVRLGWEIAALLSPRLGELLAPLFIVALTVAALGGFSVLLGGYILAEHSRHAGKVFILLGTGTGLLGFALNLALAIAAGANPVTYLISTGLTIHGLGVLFSLYAQATG